MGSSVEAGCSYFAIIALSLEATANFVFFIQDLSHGAKNFDFNQFLIDGCDKFYLHSRQKAFLFFMLSLRLK